mgnify:CR=1 FL=1
MGIIYQWPICFRLVIDHISYISLILFCITIHWIIFRINIWILICNIYLLRISCSWYFGLLIIRLFFLLLPIGNLDVGDNIIKNTMIKITLLILEKGWFEHIVIFGNFRLVEEIVIPMGFVFLVVILLLLLFFLPILLFFLLAYIVLVISFWFGFRIGIFFLVHHVIIVTNFIALGWSVWYFSW